MITTVQKKYLDHPEIADAMFGDRPAKQIYCRMQFVAAGKHYQVENVYVSWYPSSNSSHCTNAMVKINVGDVYFPGMGTAPAWFNPCAGIQWVAGSLGEGMQVRTPDGNTGQILDVFPNRVCVVEFTDKSKKTFPESQLTEINPL